jgi:hypothetical protein
LDEVARTISRFANSFDLKDWSGPESLLAEQIEVDYSDLRGERRTVSRGDYVAQRRSALESLDTHHLLSNAEIEARVDSATCRVSGLIQRRRDEKFFHSHVIYHFRLQRRSGSWCICSITQKVLWSEGDSSIHAGAQRPPIAPAV